MGRKIVQAQGNLNPDQDQDIDFGSAILNAAFQRFKMTPKGREIMFTLGPVLESLRTGRTPAGFGFHVPGTQLGSAGLRSGGDKEVGRTDEDIEKYRVIGLNDLIRMKELSSTPWKNLISRMIRGVSNTVRRLYDPAV